MEYSLIVGKVQGKYIASTLDKGTRALGGSSYFLNEEEYNEVKRRKEVYDIGAREGITDSNMLGTRVMVETLQCGKLKAKELPSLAIEKDNITAYCGRHAVEMLYRNASDKKILSTFDVYAEIMLEYAEEFKAIEIIVDKIGKKLDKCNYASVNVYWDKKEGIHKISSITIRVEGKEYDHKASWRTDREDRYRIPEDRYSTELLSKVVGKIIVGNYKLSKEYNEVEYFIDFNLGDVYVGYRK